MNVDELSDSELEARLDQRGYTPAQVVLLVHNRGTYAGARLLERLLELEAG